MTVMVPDETGRANLFAYLATLKDTTSEAKPAGPAVPKITGPTQAELDGAVGATETWLYASHDYAGTRFVDLDQITPENAETCVRSASTARSNRLRCRPARWSMAG